MQSRFTPSNTDMKRYTANRACSAAVLMLALAPFSASAAEPVARLAERYASGIEYQVVKRGEPKPLPPVTVVAPSAPPPVHEVVVTPMDRVNIAGEDLIFAQIMQAEADAGCAPGEECRIPLEPEISIPPGDSLTPDAPFGTRRNVLEL